MIAGPKRLTFFLPSMDGGGAEAVMLVLANHFAQSGTEVDLVLTRARGRFLKRIDPAIRIVDLASPSILAGIPGLALYFVRSRPTIVVSATNRANIAALMAKRLVSSRAKLIVTEHTNIASATQTDRGLFGRTIPLLIRRFYPGADGIVAVSMGVAAALADKAGVPRERIEVIYNPVVTNELARYAQLIPEHPFFASKRLPVVLSAGRLHPSKDYGTLLLAFSLLKQAYPCHLIIIGEGAERVRLEEQMHALGLSDADVSLPGFVENPYSYMRHADLFVVSSKNEGLPSALIEAMACGTPVVSTDCPSGPSEILEGGKWGRLVRVSDATGLAAAMQAALVDPAPPDVRFRAADFSASRSIAAYGALLGGS